MRIRTSAAAITTGAIALTCLTAPAAQAAEKPAGPSAFAVKMQGDDITIGNTKVWNAVLNGGKPIIVGVSKKKKVTLTFNASDNSGVLGSAGLWRGKNLDEMEAAIEADQPEVGCTGKSATKTCKMTFTFDPKSGFLNNGMAGRWKLGIAALAKDEDLAVKGNARSALLQRLSKISINVSPEPVKKGKTLTVTGSLTRANWESGKYAGYTKQPVQLQFRKKGGKTFTTVKTVKTDSKGNLKTTVKASADGTYRYSFAGNSTTPAITNGGDFIDVR
ncbi:hypothetical protein GCM10010387_17250 [Streptomyces inusitatus]|uniref:Calcium-binding protein n=1 Tax=Streptomyces inusitatus TaxID=68221 RepID=A0A918PVL1_9ACTN|nr:calcium-binding protein [Streptomyces inusitatus]GGZ24416.1 hypothetical protein GCM10010387_17250 [Streptomyces inusitatus]